MAKIEETAEGASVKSALIFEMDNVALGARRIRYEVLAGILKEQQIELSPVQFARYCLHPSPAVFMPSFLEKMNYTAAPADQVVERLIGETTSRLMQKTTAVDAGLAQWLDVARDRGAAIACISMLPAQTAEAVAAHLDFARWNALVSSGASADKSFPHPDTWLSIAKSLGRNPKRCVAVVSSMASAKAALAAMMNVVAVPDEFTDYQDFGGVNLVCSNLSEVPATGFFDEISL